MQVLGTGQGLGRAIGAATRSASGVRADAIVPVPRGCRSSRHAARHGGITAMLCVLALERNTCFRTIGGRGHRRRGRRRLHRGDVLGQPRVQGGAVHGRPELALPARPRDATFDRAELRARETGLDAHAVRALGRRHRHGRRRDARQPVRADRVRGGKSPAAAMAGFHESPSPSGRSSSARLPPRRQLDPPPKAERIEGWSAWHATPTSPNSPSCHARSRSRRSSSCRRSSWPARCAADIVMKP